MTTSHLPTAPADVDPGLLLGRYRLGRLLGAGAFATVHAARDERLQRDVAIKIAPRERVIPRRFEAEARAAARLSHPAIVTLHEAAVDETAAYLVSELVRGATLERLLATRRVGDLDIVEIGLALADALAHAHAHGVIHRDLKPSNVLVPARRAADSPAAKLTDFGVARVLGADALTCPGEIVGTRLYMAPEQAEGREAGPAADLYALSLVLHEALTGENPVRALAVSGSESRLGLQLPPLRRRRRDLPRELGQAIDRALRPHPDERGELDELRQALLAARERLGAVAVPPPGDRAAPHTAGTGRSLRAAGPPAGGPRQAARRAAVAWPARQTPVTWPAGAVGALAAAASAWWLCGHLLTRAPVTGVTAGLIAGLAALVVPRLGAVAATVAFAVLAVADGRAGGAVVLLGVALATVALLPGKGRLWPAPAGAAALALLGVGIAWPVMVGISGLSLPRRAGLAAAGAIWAAAAGALSGHAGIVGSARIPPPGTWSGSVPFAVHDLVIRAAPQAVLPVALSWALVAALLPLPLLLRRWWRRRRADSPLP